MAEWAVLQEKEGRIHIVEVANDMVKYKGLGVFNSAALLADIAIGEEVLIGQKYLMRLPARLPELVAGMARRAQTISAKDAGAFITRLGIGEGDLVLEAGLGSGGLSLHLARVLGKGGHLMTVEPRDEHAEVGLLNLERASSCFPSFPKHTHLSGLVEDVIPDEKFDAIILDLPDHAPAISACAEKLIFNDTTTGAGNDIAVATDISRKMVSEWGMTDAVGPLAFSKKTEEVFLGRDISQGNDLSDVVCNLIDSEVTKIVKTAEKNADDILIKHIDQLHAIAKALLEFETIDGKDLAKLINGEKIHSEKLSDSKPERRRRNKDVPNEDKST